MKNILSLIIGLLFCFSTQNVVAQGFEGSYEVNVTTNKKNGKAEKVKMTAYFKGKKMRMDMVDLNEPNSKPLLSFIDFEDSTMTMIMNKDGRNSGMKMKMPKGDKAIKKIDTDKYKFTKTSETKVIEGKTATKMIVETDETNEEFWVVPNMGVSRREISNAFSDAAGDMKKYKELYAELDKIGGMPLDSKITNKKNGDITDVQIRNFKREAIAESLFDTSSYEIMDLTNMMKR